MSLTFFLSFFSAFFLGLIASLNPCTIPIYPLLFSFYLKKDNKISVKKVSLFLTGFFLGFIIIAIFFLLFNDFIILQEGIKFIAAGITALLGIAFLMNKINFYYLEVFLGRINNPIFFGLIFGFAINPCSLPLFLATISLSLAINSIILIIGFGAGVIVVPLLMAIFGSVFIKKLGAKIRGFYDYLNKVVGIFLLIASFSFIFLASATPLTAVISSLIILLFFFFLIKPILKNDIKKGLCLEKILFLTFFFFSWLIITFNCYFVSFSTGMSCGLVCNHCRFCLSLLVINFIIGYLGVHYIRK